MYDLVARYLSKTCVIEDCLGYDIMCKFYGHQKWCLEKELSEIFTITYNEARLYADLWAVSIEPDVDLNVYWATSHM